MLMSAVADVLTSPNFLHPFSTVNTQPTLPPEEGSLKNLMSPGFPFTVGVVLITETSLATVALP